MRIVPVSLLWLATLAAPAWAEDFTGAYAGVNVGYAVSEPDRTPLRSNPFDPGGAGANEMPPSARQASEALRTRNLRDRAGSIPR